MSTKKSLSFNAFLLRAHLGLVGLAVLYGIAVLLVLTPIIQTQLVTLLAESITS
jgi:hypothetical protein